jgi:hypothetical protein
MIEKHVVGGSRKRKLKDQDDQVVDYFRYSAARGDTAAQVRSPPHAPLAPAPVPHLFLVVYVFDFRSQYSCKLVHMRGVSPCAMIPCEAPSQPNTHFATWF